MAADKHSLHAPAHSTVQPHSVQYPPSEASSIEVLEVPAEAVVVITCRVTPTPQEIEATVAVVRQTFPKNKVLIVNGNLDVSLLTDQQLRSLGLVRVH